MKKISSIAEMEEWFLKPGEKRRAVFFSLLKSREMEYIFLRYAKEKKFKWINGDDIEPGMDNCGGFMSLNSEHTMGFVSVQIYMMGREHEYFAYADTEMVIKEMQNYLTQIY